jgi:hypothetical protein
MKPQTILFMALLFVTPIVAVLALNSDVIFEDMTPRPENGFVIYVTADT